MKILVFNQQRDLSIKTPSAKPIVREVLASECVHTDELSIYFVSDVEISRLHQEYFDDPSPTDCISFPLDDPNDQSAGYHILGEIFLSPHAALANTDQPVYQELTLYLVHALLHLLGYDDVEEKKRKKMRGAEEKHMTHLLNKKLLLKGN